MRMSLFGDSTPFLLISKADKELIRVSPQEEHQDKKRQHLRVYRRLLAEALVWEMVSATAGGRAFRSQTWRFHTLILSRTGMTH